MEHRIITINAFILSLVLIMVSFCSNFQVGEAYKNYTVGDSLGWFDKLMVPKVNYQKWAASKNFTLGDFLIFNSDRNHSVVQTYNVTIYKNCDYNDADQSDTTEWSSGAPKFDSSPITVAVPLLKEGTSYFFSGNYDGEQCQHGQHFKINVAHGQGLPPSLRNSPDQSPSAQSPAGSVAADNGADAVPDTVVPSNFDNPKGSSDDDGDVKATSKAAVILESRRLGLGLVVILFLINVFC